MKWWTFTLIELLIVVTIIAILAATLLPVLGRVRRRTQDINCLSRLKQIGAAMLMYEDEQARLPTHVFELSLPNPDKVDPNQLTQGSAVPPELDLRTCLTDYVSADFLQCPHLPRLPLHTADSRYVFADYDLFPGYFGDFESGSYTDVWFRSTEFFTFNGRQINALAGDRMYYDNGNVLPLRDNIVNHAGSAADFDVEVMNDNTFVWSTAYGRLGYDARSLFTGGFVFADGSAGVYQGNDPALVRLPTRNSDLISAGGNHLIPVAP